MKSGPRQAGRTRLDRFLRTSSGLQGRELRTLLAQGRVRVDGRVAHDINQVVDEFSQILLDDQVLQENQAVYLMLHKPTGVVSATRDARHTTVLDLIDRPDKAGLHIAGRLDCTSTGLLLLTNDGRWSRQLSAPASAIGKLYRVTLEQPVSAACVEAFSDGMYFAYEGITTRPASLTLLTDHVVEVTLVEGRYHQIKRMFGRFHNRVLALHRAAIGELQLDTALQPGQHRPLTTAEIAVLATGEQTTLPPAEPASD